MSTISLAEDYEGAYEELSRVPQQLDAVETERFADLVKELSNARILDLGCAEGRLAELLALRGHSVVAADISETVLQRVVDRAKAGGTSIEAKRMDIETGTGGLPPASFSAVFFMDVIEHLRNPIVALQNIRTLMKDNGVLIIHTPNAISVRRLWWSLRHRHALMNYFDPRNLEDLHFETYDYLSLEKALNFVGFRVKELIPTKLTLPSSRRLTRLSKWLSPPVARIFPAFSDTLLVRCEKCEPLDIRAAVAFWASRGTGTFH